MERWRARLNMVADAPEQQPGDEPEAAAAEAMQTEQPQAEEAGAEYRFLGQQEQQQAGDTQVLASATEEQALQQARGAEEDEEAGGDAEAGAAADEQEAEEEAPMDAEHRQQQQKVMSGAAKWGAGADREARMETGDGEHEEQQAEETEAAEDSEQQAEEGEVGDQMEAAVESYVTARLQAATLEDGGPGDEVSEACLVGSACKKAPLFSLPSDSHHHCTGFLPAAVGAGGARRGGCCRAA